MILTALIALVAPFNFKGGGDSDLVGAVHLSLGENVACVVAPARRWPKASFDFAKKEDLELAIKRRYELIPSRQFLASEAAYPRDFFLKQALSGYESRLPQVNLAASLRRFPLEIDPAHTPYLSVAQIQEICSSKPLQSHWFYNGLRIAVAGRFETPAELEKLVAATIGAKLVETTKGAKFDFDADAVRTRSVKSFSDWAGIAKQPGDLLNARYLVALFQQLTNQALDEVYSKPENTVEYKLSSDSEIAKMAYQRLWLKVGSPEADEKSMDSNMRARRKDLYSHVDFDLGIWAVVYSNGVPSCRVKGDNWGCTFC